MPPDADMDVSPETLENEEDLHKRHRKEQRDLQSRITQKKKQANKKNRKGVNDECTRLEEELKERQESELASLRSEGGAQAEEGAKPSDDVPGEELACLSINGSAENDGNLGEEQDGNGAATKTIEEDGDAIPIAAAESAAIPKKRNRAKDRLARRAAEQEEQVRQAQEEAQNLPDKKVQERERMLAAMIERGLREREIRADGHCLYSAVADQLDNLGVPLTSAVQHDIVTNGDAQVAEGKQQQLPYKIVRAQAAAYIEAHSDDFVPFLEEPLEEYVHKVRDTGEWGGQIELMALAKTFGRDICVLQDFGRVERIEAGGEGTGKKGDNDKETPMWLGYYKHGFGLGEHYNSLRKAP